MFFFYIDLFGQLTSEGELSVFEVSWGEFHSLLK